MLVRKGYVFMNKVGHETSGYADVSVNDQHIITCVLRGFITGEIVRTSLAETKKYADQLRQQHQPAYLLIDANGVTGQDSGARSLAKTIGDMGLAKVAICNRSLALGMVIQYLIRAGGMAAYARVFSGRPVAIAWLLSNKTTDNQPLTYSKLRIGLAILVATIAGTAFIGWVVDNEIMRSWFYHLRPMNPVVACLLVLQAVSLLVIKKADQPLLAGRRNFVLAVAGASLLFGLLVLLQTTSGFNLHVDDFLFHGSINNQSAANHVAPRTALLVGLVGLMQLTILAGQRRLWQRYVFHTASVTAFAVSLFSVVGYGFGAANSEHFITLLPTPLNTAVCILLLNHALQTVTIPLSFFERSWQRFNQYNQAYLVCLGIILLTGAAWHQSNIDQSKTSFNATKEQFDEADNLVNDKLNTYINTLRGYRSFFEASDFVSAKEYQTFFNSSKLSTYYPGFTALSFVRSIPANERAALQASMRQQADADFPSYSRFAIFPTSERSVLYPTVYVEPHTATTNYGFDLATNDIRRQTLETARDSGELAASDTIDLNASRADSSLPKRPGFYLTIPVYKSPATSGVPATLAERQTTIYGFVNAIFEDNILFTDTFKNVHDQDIQFKITNERSGEVLYTHNPKAKGLQREPVYGDKIMIAGQVWRLAVYTPPHFGVNGIGRYFPQLVLAGGLLVAILAAALIAGQVRRKEQAVKLASDMTEDLNNERNTAVTIQQKDEAILSSIGDAVFAIDSRKRIILFNRAAAAITTFKEQAVLGKPYTDIFRFRHEKDGKPASSFIDTALAGKPSAMPQGTVLARPDGTLIPIADSAAPIVGIKGQVEGAVVVFRDVTREKELEKLKNDFVSMASHELRTPMGAVRAMSSMILAGDYGRVNKNLVEPLTDIHSATVRLVDLVNDLLNVARIEANRMKFDLKDTDLKNILKTTANSLAPLGTEKHITIGLETGRLPKVQIDSGKVTQVITNLVGNALKFTDHGSITIGATAQKDAVEVTVTDTGMGISATDQQKLFSKFQQISSAQAGRPAGTGLGLYISREIVRKMGGDLWIKRSALGKGTTFAFTLVYAGSPKAARIKRDRTSDEKLHPDSV